MSSDQGAQSWVIIP